ncbi:MAG TPA: RNA polymerase factor sigma-54 [Candidatus Acidoferrales bacterium]|nr:RNA polymerase factor sigma-54 [Candidatus Acidoferrales bacterium]
MLQPRLNLKVSQKQILTPGLVQMVSVLALNKLELKDMINEELVENPVLDEYVETVPTLDEVAAKEEQRERESTPTDEPQAATPEERDPFEEIDFGSFFQDYLDPGFRSGTDLESIEKPSFENFLSKPTTLTDHLMWQLGAIHVKEDVRAACELVIGNLEDDGYLLSTEEELLAQAAWDGKPRIPIDPKEVEAAEAERAKSEANASAEVGTIAASIETAEVSTPGNGTSPDASGTRPALVPKPAIPCKALFGRDALHEAIDLIKQMDPVGVASRDLRECLIAQLKYLLAQHEERGGEPNFPELAEDALKIIEKHLHLLQNKQLKEIAKAESITVDRVNECIKLIQTLDPKPGLRYNKQETRLIEPDVAFIKQGDEYLVMMNDDDLPQLRLNPTYKKLLTREAAEKDVRNYVKERYKSAIQLIKNIEQRKQTILKVCYSIIGRQKDFLDKGIDQLKPMMIKEVAEEIGVHPSTVSRAVASKYVHTPQGVFELRYFFSESVNGPEGGGTSLLILKRRVKKLIEEEDPTRPLTDEQITRILQSQGIQVTRRTVAKYREDMKIPSTHQRRVRN